MDITRGDDFLRSDVRGRTRSEIQALLESPELRRIFEEEPGKALTSRSFAGRRQPHGAAARSCGSADPSARPAARPGKRTFRIALGLMPICLAGLILSFEIVREPIASLQVFGTPSAAEETGSRTGTKGLPILASDGDALAVHASGDGAAAPEASLAASDAGGPDAGSSAAMPPAMSTPAKHGKSAGDLAKPASGRASRARAAAVDASLANVAAVLHEDGARLGDVPHPGARDGRIAAAEPTGPAAAAASEQSLGLSRGDRREMQRRLRLARFDPGPIDGLFGPATRRALAAWQAAAGLPATGHVNKASLTLLVKQTADEYHAWRSAERARARRKEAQSSIVVSSAPPAPLADPGECRRLASGEIVFGTGFSCNLRGLGENVQDDFRELGRDLGRLLRRSGSSADEGR